jgi:hypothetical protein
VCSTLIGGCYATLRLPAVAVATQLLRYATALRRVLSHLPGVRSLNVMTMKAARWSPTTRLVQMHYVT